MQKDVVSATSDTIEKSDLTDDGFVKKLNVLSGLSGYLYKNFANKLPYTKELLYTPN